MQVDEFDVLAEGMLFIPDTAYSDRVWKAHYKFTVAEITTVANMLPATSVRQLLFWLYFVKTYPTYDQLRGWSHLDPKTFRTHLRATTNQLEAGIPQVYT